jgi:general secretion pathway protein J
MSARGFTLAEVMIAMGITTLIGGLVWSSFSTTFKAKELIEGEAGIYRELRVGTSRLTRELSMAFISRNYDTARYRDHTDRPTFFTGERDRVSFSMLGHQRLARDAKESDQSIVFYKVDRDPEQKGGTALLRCEKPVIDEYPDRCDRWETLIAGVRRLELRYWDNKRNDWVDIWDTRLNEHPDQLPDRVRIELTARDDQGKDRTYVTQARINLVTVLESK